MVGSMDSGMDSLTDIPIKIRTKEKLTIYVVWEVTVDTDTRMVEMSGAMKHVPEDTDNDTDQGKTHGVYSLECNSGHGH